MYVICGLGNPGKVYEATRHNMGFITVDILADMLGIQVRQLKFRALVGEGRIGREKIILVKPQTYMNLSGEAVRQVVDYYKPDPDKLIVIYDDVDLPAGTLRIRPFGSAGTHNGMRSVVYQLGRDDFPRMRIGVGSSGVIPLDRYVIGRWTESERPLLAEAAQNAAKACVCAVEEGLGRAMNLYNTKTEKKKKKAPEAEEGCSETPEGAQAAAAGDIEEPKETETEKTDDN